MENPFRKQKKITHEPETKKILVSQSYMVQTSNRPLRTLQNVPNESNAPRKRINDLLNFQRTSKNAQERSVWIENV